MLTKIKMAGLIMAVMALSAPMVYADNGGGDKDSWHQDGDWHHGPKDHMMAKVLNLTDDQQKQMKESWKKQRESMKSVFAQMKSNREALNAEIVKASPDMTKINSAQTQIKALQSQMADDQLNSLLEIKKILTSEQFAGFMALQKESMLKKHGMGYNKFEHHESDKQDQGDKD